MRGTSIGFIGSLILFGTAVGAYFVPDKPVALALAVASAILFFLCLISREG